MSQVWRVRSFARKSAILVRRLIRLRGLHGSLVANDGRGQIRMAATENELRYAGGNSSLLRGGLGFDGVEVDIALLPVDGTGSNDGLLAQGDGWRQRSTRIIIGADTCICLGKYRLGPIARFALKCALSHKNCPMAGPGAQVLAMLSLFLPMILIATFVPGMLDLSEIWSAASLTIIGVLLSAVVAQPLRCFFLEWVELNLNKNGDR